MISHPAADYLIGKHGNTAGGRAAARSELAATMRAKLEAAIARAARSPRCSIGDHASTHEKLGRVGCLNDGTSCVCECHDPVGASSVPRSKVIDGGVA